MTDSRHSRGTFENIAHCSKCVWHFGIISPEGFIGNELIATSSKPAFPGFEALGLWGEGREGGRRHPWHLSRYLANHLEASVEGHWKTVLKEADLVQFNICDGSASP